jgi:hypothetical protein
MSGQEICIVVIPNDFPKEEEEEEKDQNINENAEHITPQVSIERFFLYRKSLSVIMLF